MRRFQPGVDLGQRRERAGEQTLLFSPGAIFGNGVAAQAERVASIEFTSGAMARLRDGLLSIIPDDISLDSTHIRSQLDQLGLKKVVELVERAITHRSDRFAEPDADAVEVETGWRHTLALHERQNGLRKALVVAGSIWNADGNEDALARIVELQRQLASPEELKISTDT